VITARYVCKEGLRCEILLRDRTVQLERGVHLAQKYGVIDYHVAEEDKSQKPCEDNYGVYPSTALCMHIQASDGEFLVTIRATNSLPSNIVSIRCSEAHNIRDRSWYSNKAIIAHQHLPSSLQSNRTIHSSSHAPRVCLSASSRSRHLTAYVHAYDALTFCSRCDDGSQMILSSGRRAGIGQHRTALQTN
jgi:hypothetical protein